MRTSYRRMVETGCGALMWLAALASMNLACAQEAPPETVPVPAVAVSDLDVSFDVVNSNRSATPCLTDGKRYTIKGHLVLPAAADPSAVTLYLHGFGWGEFFFHLTDVPELDYASAMARLGHASLVIDRLGYDRSGHPDGILSSCLGSQADIAHQIVQSLRNGRYQVEGRDAPPRFRKVGLAGHSAAGAIVEIEAYSFRDVDALAVLGWADIGASPAAILALVNSALVCTFGGNPAEQGQPGGYAYFGQSANDFLALEVFDAEDSLRSLVASRRNRDPCGDLNSSAIALGINAVHVGLLREIAVPTLLVCGNQDAVFPPPACQLQQVLFSSPKLTPVFIDGIGHGLTLERRSGLFRQTMADWLDANGL